MKILFVRHGHASRFGLTDYGRTQMMATAHFLRQMNLNVLEVCLLSSPRMRALNSASIIQEVLNLPDFRVVDWLDDGSGGHRIREEIEHLADQPSLYSTFIAISHEPEIENALKAAGRQFGLDFHPYVARGSAHLVETNTRMITRLFEP